MVRSRLTTRILFEIETLILESFSANGEPIQAHEELYFALLKKHYNAASVNIDYDRHRITMDVIVNDDEYHANQVNLVLTTTPVNLFYDNLSDFLLSCLDTDIKSLAFYSRLIQLYANKNVAIAV